MGKENDNAKLTAIAIACENLLFLLQKKEVRGFVLDNQKQLLRLTSLLVEMSCLAYQIAMYESESDGTERTLH